MCKIMEDYAKEYAKDQNLIQLFEMLDEGMVTKENAIKKSGLTEEEFDRKRAELLLNV